MDQNHAKEHKQNNRLDPGTTDGIEVTFYTDPLCCWSWAMWPQWEKFRDGLNCPVTVTYKMAGLLPSWLHFNDTLNSITKPSQMGPEWAHAKAIGNVPINDRIWITDPPASSYPACIGVKAVQLQSAAAAADYLLSLRQAVMVDNLNISRTDILLDLAARLGNKYPDFDPILFREDLLGIRGKKEFEKDLQETKYLNITRLPTLVLRFPGRSPLLLSGYRSYESLMAATAAPDNIHHT